MLRDIFLEYYGGTVFLTDEFKTSECPSFHHSSIVLVVSLLKEQAYNVNKVSKFITEKHIKEDLFSVFFWGVLISISIIKHYTINLHCRNI